MIYYIVRDLKLGTMTPFRDVESLRSHLWGKTRSDFDVFVRAGSCPINASKLSEWADAVENAIGHATARWADTAMDEEGDPYSYREAVKSDRQKTRRHS